MKGMNLMRADEFIRDECEMDAFMGDEDLVGYCDGCHEPIRSGEYVMSIIRDGGRRSVEYTFCERCLDEMPLSEILDCMAIDYRHGFAEDAIPDAKDAAAMQNAQRRAAFRRTITTAAKMAKEARA